MDTIKTKQPTHKSLQKALEILVSFVPNNQKIGIFELSERLGMHRSTVSRILGILAHYRFVQKDTLSNKYCLGTMAVNIGHAVIKSLNTDWVMLAKPYADNLCDAIQETVALELVSDKTTVLVYLVDGQHPVKVSVRLGDKLPRHAAAGPKVVMAFSPSELAEDLFKNDTLPRLTPNTITDPKILKQKIKEYKQQGFAIDAEERELDVYAAAAPIFDHSNKVVGAVTIVAPSYRTRSAFSRNNISLLKKTAEEISSSFHFDKDLKGNPK